MDKTAVAAALEEMAELLELKGENSFRVRSYRNGARAVEGIAGDLREVAAAGKLLEVPGIGATLASIILELLNTGSSPRLEELRSEVPAGMRELVHIPGLGPKKARVLLTELGISTLATLEQACLDGKVAGLKGFGKKTADRILAGIAYRRTVEGRFLLPEGLAAAAPLRQYLEEDPAVRRVEIAGSLRRCRETIRDIDLVAAVAGEAQAGAVMERFIRWPGVVEVIAKGDTKSSVRLGGGLQADLRVVEEKQFPFAWQHFTGSKEHNTALRGLAKDRGLKLNEYGLFRIGDDAASLACADEAAIYEGLGLQYVPPELREDLGEIDLARARGLPELVRFEDLRGILHVHTRYSDGQATLEEMAEAAQAGGFEYLGISDHSQSAGYAGGLKEEDIARQHAHIDALNGKLSGLRIFKGIESDIRLDGSLDYPARVLDSFDFVIASVHSGFHLPVGEQTARVLRALEDPHTTILAHPTGRLLLQRAGFEIHMEQVLEAAGRLGVVVEINAHPLRLDLDWRWGALARKHGVRTSINPDAHAVAGYGDMRYGLGIARKAGFSASQVINTFGVGEMEGFLKLRKQG